MSRLSEARDAVVQFARDSRKRRIGYVVLASLLAVLCLFPRHYTARVKVVLDDPDSGGLVSLIGAFGGRAQNFASLFSGSTTDVALQLASSQSITDRVITTMKLAGPGRRYPTFRMAQLGLNSHVDVHSLTGGMIEIEVKSTDGPWALAVTNGYLDAISDRIATYGREQVVRKRGIIESRFAGAGQSVTRAEVALNDFRLRNRLADPQAQLGSQLALRTGQEAQLQAKLIELDTLRQVAGPGAISIRTLETQIAGLRGQIASASQPSMTPSGPTLGAISNVSLEYARLFRTYLFSQAIYEVYARSMEEVSVQEIVALGSGQLAIVDPPHIEPKRQFNTNAFALLALLLLIVFFTEIYIPITTTPGARNVEQDD